VAKHYVMKSVAGSDGSPSGDRHVRPGVDPAQRMLAYERVSEALSRCPRSRQFGVGTTQKQSPTPLMYGACFRSKDIKTHCTSELRRPACEG